MLKCPVCRATYRPKENQLCHRCGADLSRLIAVHDQAMWHYHQAIHHFKLGDDPTAQIYVEQAIALNSHNADFQALAGTLWVRQGKFQQAIEAWQQAVDLDPGHGVKPYLRLLLEGERSATN
jgi:tetratricopeptide (TPR) repeat protein